MCSRRRTCGNSWNYSWSYGGYGTPQVQYYYYGTPQQASQSQTTQSASSSSKSSGGPPISAEDFDGDYHEYGLYLHNWYRRRHGSPEMTLVERLNNAGDNYCYKLAGMRTLVHSTGLDYNENLYMSTDTSLSKKEHVRLACKCWYDEIQHYSFNNPGFSMQTGHFTAMVWKESTQLGIGCWESNGCVVVAGCYKPHANMQGKFNSCVLPYRDVDDSDENSKSKKKKEKQKKEKEEKEKEEAEKAKKDEKKKKDEEEKKKKDEEKKKQKEEEMKKEMELNEEAKTSFNDKADANGTIGCIELQELLNKFFEVNFKFDGFDKIISALLISTITIREGEKNRIDISEFRQALECVEGILESYSFFDKDLSGTLDPFELKDALTEAGFKISYRTFLTLQSLFGDPNSDVMQFRGFVLAFLLLCKLQVFQQKRSAGEFEDFSMKEWMQQQLTSLGS